MIVKTIKWMAGFLIPGLALIGMRWTGCDKVAAITLVNYSPYSSSSGEMGKINSRIV